MTFELHVWAPAFSLPSIDAQCVAAVAYLSLAVPRGKWSLIASSTATLTTPKNLPALKDGDSWVGGFSNIVHHIDRVSNSKWSLDSNLSSYQKTELKAYSTHLITKAQPLLDVTLFVSADNYAAAVRPLLSALLPFPLAYTVPPLLRAAARERTAFLGLSSTDVDIDDNASPSSSSSTSAPFGGGGGGGNSIIPASLRPRGPAASVSSLLSQTPESEARIRLAAAADDVFGPLQALLLQPGDGDGDGAAADVGSENGAAEDGTESAREKSSNGDSRAKDMKRFLMSASRPSSLDCLALGYLALMLAPKDLPQPWLAGTLRGKYPRLCGFVREMRWAAGLGGDDDDDDGDSAGNDDGDDGDEEVGGFHAGREAGKRGRRTELPWKQQEEPGAAEVAALFVGSLAGNLPGAERVRRAVQLGEFANM